MIKGQNKIISSRMSFLGQYIYAMVAFVVDVADANFLRKLEEGSTITNERTTRVRGIN